MCDKQKLTLLLLVQTESAGLRTNYFHYKDLNFFFFFLRNMKTQSTNCVVSLISNAGTQQFLLQFIVYQVVNDKDVNHYLIFTIYGSSHDKL